ncbi:MAG TPA: deoxyribodipyrimidine photo-lyase [Verrucomicrobiae bacterium]|nr:deoxyribodipyrimidine photo-lyase [Verrucomicrobiae bacterium]
MPTLLWFRQDLRLADNPALAAALQRGEPVLPVFIWAPEEEGEWPPGGASRWWLHHSLRALAADLHALGARLVLRRGPTEPALRALLQETGAQAVYWNRRYEPAIVKRDTQLKGALKGAGITVESFNAALLHEPWQIQNKAGKPFQVFTPFWRHCLALPEPEVPLAVPHQWPSPARWPASLNLADLALEPVIDWAGGLREAWQPGTAGAAAQLDRFVRDAFADYPEHRNRPDLVGTSRLSPHLHFGEISPRQIWHALRQASPASGKSAPESGWRDSQFLAEVGWREFAHHLLYHFPHTPTEPLRAEFAQFPWQPNADWLKAWQRGQTGVPLVDAGMRELWTTGWMHNRVRMVVASFLVKNLLLPWTDGARWFWDTLVDADLAQNTLGWQWTAGCGADAAPYFRVFNPVSQGAKFDPEGHYVRRWVPELAGLPAAWIHQPWAAPAAELARASVRLGQTYPAPLVSLSISREVALAAYARMRG